MLSHHQLLCLRVGVAGLVVPVGHSIGPMGRGLPRGREQASELDLAMLLDGCPLVRGGEGP